METLDMDEESSQGILSTIIGRFFSCGLITEKKKNDLCQISEVEDKRAEIYKLLAKNDPTAGGEMLKIIQSVESVKRHSWRLILEKANVAMQTDVVIMETLSYLKYTDIKSCRLVCKRWKRIVEPQYRKLSKLVFHRTNEKKVQIDEVIETINSSEISVPFNSFKFQSSEACWTVSEITKFLKTHTADVEELEFKWVHLMGEKRRARPFDICHWVVNLPLQLKVLKIDCLEEIVNRSTLFKIPLHSLHSISDINLRGCRVIVGAGPKISPSNLSLNKVLFYHDGNLLTECVINQYVNFERIVSIAFGSIDYNLLLDFTESINVDYVSLTFVKMLNLDTSKWNVRHFHMYCMYFLEKTTMKVQELICECCEIDLAFLPPQISKLAIDFCKIICNAPVALPSLKWLELHRQQNSDLTYFKDCLSLENVAIVGQKYNSEIDLADLANSVIRLKLEKIERLVLPEETLKLQRLVLDDVTITLASQALSKIYVKFAIVRLDFRTDGKFKKMIYDHFRKDNYVKMVCHIDGDWVKGACVCSKCDSLN